MKTAFNNIILSGLIIALILAGSIASAETIIKSGARLAIIQFADYTDNQTSAQILEPILKSELNRLGLNIIASDSLKNILRTHRIRAVGEISNRGLKLLKNENSLDLLLLGSYNIVENSEDPEIWISLRLIDINTGSIILASSASSTGSDQSGAFGLGKIDKIEELAKKIIKEMLENLNGSKPIRNTSDNHPQYALIPFDNGSKYAHAGEIMAIQFLTELSASGHEVIEPGFVASALRNLGRVSRGEIDLESAKLLHEKFGADYIITGMLDKFATKAPGAINSSPKLGFGARIIDAATGRLISAIELAQDGSDSELIFNIGTHQSLGKLTESMVIKCLNKFDKSLEQYVNKK